MPGETITNNRLTEATCGSQVDEEEENKRKESKQLLQIGCFNDYIRITRNYAFPDSFLGPKIEKKPSFEEMLTEHTVKNTPAGVKFMNDIWYAWWDIFHW